MGIEIREPGAIRAQLEEDINADFDPDQSVVDIDPTVTRPQLAEDIGEVTSSAVEIEQELR